MKKKIALITGITGQDGSYLAEFLLNKKYIVHGIKRKSSSFNTSRVDHIYNSNNKNFFLHYGDLTDSNNTYNIIKKIKPDEIYNLAAQSHVMVSFEMPEYTANVNALGALRILESIRGLGFEKKTKYYQASTSEIFGSSNPPQNEKTQFKPQSPYGVAKLFAHWITINYRDSYKIFACNGILFNHESPRRGETFVTKKIISALVRIKLGYNECLQLGNLEAKRDWGHAKDYVEAQWLILQQKKPQDFVISTGKSITIRKFVEKVLKHLKIKYKWVGKNLNEKCINVQNNKTIIKINKKYFRPSEVNSLRGNSNKAKKVLNWKPKFDINLLIKDMVKNELNDLNK